MKARTKSVLLNYATPEFRVSQSQNCKTGIEIGLFDSAISLGPHSLSRSFRKQHASILSQSRGAGLWLWKPYIILKTLQKLRPGDVLFYCDSGAYFQSSAVPLLDIARMEESVICFNVGHLERHWSKRDAFMLMRCDSPEFVDTPMRLATFIVAKKSELSIEFFHQYLSYASDYRIVSDAPNEMGLPNYEGFQENRHDQTVFSLLTKKWGFPCYRDPSSPPEFLFEGTKPSLYPQIIVHTRQRNPVAINPAMASAIAAKRKLAAIFRNMWSR
jgi:hypothetical protein